MLNFDVDTSDRLDKFLASKVVVSRSKVQKAIKEGQVFVDGIVVLESDFNVTVGNKVSLPEFEPEVMKPSDIKLKIVFENNDLAVIDKPAGLVVHPGAGNTEDTLSNALLSYFPLIKDVGEPHRPGIVHRLDEDTSGLIVVAKTPAAYDFLKNTFLQRDIEKEYLALVHGQLEKHHDVINIPIEKVPNRQKMKVGSGKESLTEYWVLDSTRPSEMGEARPTQGGAAGQFTLIRVKLHTGRTHQIRVHMQAIGHPLVGDEVYGGIFKALDKQIVNRQFLHAYRLKFKLMDGTWIELVSPLPADLQAVLSKIGIIYENSKF